MVSPIEVRVIPPPLSRERVGHLTPTSDQAKRWRLRHHPLRHIPRPVGLFIPEASRKEQRAQIGWQVTADVRVQSDAEARAMPQDAPEVGSACTRRR